MKTTSLTNLESITNLNFLSNVEMIETNGGLRHVTATLLFIDSESIGKGVTRYTYYDSSIDREIAVFAKGATILGYEIYEVNTWSPINVYK